MPTSYLGIRSIFSRRKSGRKWKFRRLQTRGLSQLRLLVRFLQLYLLRTPQRRLLRGVFYKGLSFLLLQLAFQRSSSASYLVREVVSLIPTEVSTGVVTQGQLTLRLGYNLYIFLCMSYALVFQVSPLYVRVRNTFGPSLRYERCSKGYSLTFLLVRSQSFFPLQFRGARRNLGQYYYITSLGYSYS